jgi:hypothetical protein
MRLRFKLKSLLLLVVLVAVSLAFATNGLRHSYIQATFVDNREIPDWWPKSWKAEFESLRLRNSNKTCIGAIEQLN